MSKGLFKLSEIISRYVGSIRSMDDIPKVLESFKIEVLSSQEYRSIQNAVSVLLKKIADYTNNQQLDEAAKANKSASSFQKRAEKMLREATERKLKNQPVNKSVPRKKTMS